MTVEEMKAVDIRTVSRDDLVDIRDVVIDQDAPKEERIKSFLRQIKNPYCFKVGNVVVKTTFADTDVTLDDRLEHYFRNKCTLAMPFSQLFDLCSLKRGAG